MSWLALSRSISLPVSFSISTVLLCSSSGQTHKVWKLVRKSERGDEKRKGHDKEVCPRCFTSGIPFVSREDLQGGNFQEREKGRELCTDWMRKRGGGQRELFPDYFFDFCIFFAVAVEWTMKGEQFYHLFIGEMIGHELHKISTWQALSDHMLHTMKREKWWVHWISLGKVNNYEETKQEITWDSPSERPEW